MYLQYLEYFREIAKYENMTKAAASLHISQPALSQTISKLEDEMHVQLFLRSHGKLSLTTAGRVYYDCVERAFAELERGERLMETFTSKQRMQIRIVSTFPHILSEIVNSYSTLGTDYTINSYVYPMEQSIYQLVQGEMDFGILPFCRPQTFVGERDILRQNKIFEEDILMLLSAQHPMCGMETVSLQDFKYEHFVLNEQNFDLESFLSLFSDVDFAPDILLSSNETRMLNPLISSGRAICLVPVSDVMWDMQEKMFRQEMAAVHIQNAPKRSIFLSQMENRVLNRAAETFCPYIIEFFHNLENSILEWERAYFHSDRDEHA